MRRRRHALTGLVAPGLVAAGLLLAVAGCGTSSSANPDWRPQQSFAAGNDPRPEVSIPNDGPAPTSAPNSAAPSQPGGTASSSPGTGPDPTVVATGLDQPTGLVVLPDGTALVGERVTGKLYRVQPQPGHQPALVQTLAGVDGAGGGGLLDLALSPTFSQDGLVYAYLSTAADNRVVHFALGSTPTPVITGIPRGSTDNGGRIAFDKTGALLVGTGDAGDPTLAEATTSLAGKILRVNDIGQPMPDNPDPTSPIFARGLRTVDGLCVNASDGTRIAVSSAGADPASPDEVNAITPGADYGWPTAATDAIGPLASLPSAATGGAGCAIAQGQLIIASTTGRSLVTGALSSSSLTALTPALTGVYGRLRTVVAGSDGALWLTTTNRDGHGTPSPADDKVIRIDASTVLGSTL